MMTFQTYRKWYEIYMKDVCFWDSHLKDMTGAKMIWIVFCCFTSIYINLWGIVLGGSEWGDDSYQKREAFLKVGAAILQSPVLTAGSLILITDVSLHSLIPYYQVLDPKSIPKTSSQEVFGCLGIIENWRKFMTHNYHSRQKKSLWDCFWPEILSV